MTRAKEWVEFDAETAAFERRERMFDAVFGVLRGVTIIGISLAIAAALLSGCGMSTLERHTMAAGLLHGGTGVAAQVIEARAQADADAATSEADLTARMERWHRAEAAQHLVAAAVDVYVAEVLAAAVVADSGEPDEARLLRALGEALSVYRALAELLSEYGIEIYSVGRIMALFGSALQPVGDAAERAAAWVGDGIGGAL